MGRWEHTFCILNDTAYPGNYIIKLIQRQNKIALKDIFRRIVRITISCIGDKLPKKTQASVCQGIDIEVQNEV